MKNMKKCLALLLALLLALSLAACGGDSSTPGDEPPTSLDDMVKDSSIEADYSGFTGAWVNDDSAELLIVEPSEDGEEMRFALCAVRCRRHGRGQRLFAVHGGVWLRLRLQ